jgi:hypothetical protein
MAECVNNSRYIPTTPTTFPPSTAPLLLLLLLLVVTAAAVAAVSFHASTNRLDVMSKIALSAPKM